MRAPRLLRTLGGAMTLSSRMPGIAAVLTAAALALPGCSEHVGQYERALPASAAVDVAAFVGSRQPADAGEAPPDADAAATAAATPAPDAAQQPSAAATTATPATAPEPTAYVSAVDGLPV